MTRIRGSVAGTVPNKTAVYSAKPNIGAAAKRSSFQKMKNPKEYDKK